MTRNRLIVFAVILLVIAIVTDQRQGISEGPAITERIERAVKRDVTTTAASAANEATDDDHSTVPSIQRSDDTENCLTLEQLESHPILAEDSYRFDSVATSGQSMAAYRDISASELNSLASQEDSAAMAVLGAISVMRARNLPESKAVPYLLHEEVVLDSYLLKRPIDSSASVHLEEASEWFYKAALHGRVLALYHVGEVLWVQKGGPVELGWIEKSEYDSLTSFQKTALLPSNVYNVLAYEIAPELLSGPHGRVIGEIMPRSERQQSILDELSTRFQEDREAAGLPPISVAASTAPPMEEMMSLLCESIRIQQGESSPSE